MAVEPKENGDGKAASENWLKSATMSVLLTAMIATIAIVAGGLSTQYLGVSTGSSFAIAVVTVIVESWLVLRFLMRMHGGSD